jgi:membrane protein
MTSERSISLFLKNLSAHVRAAYRHYVSFRPTRLASSLSYYGLFALVPVLAVTFWIGTYIVRAQAIGTDIIYRVSYIIGPESTEFIKTTFENVTAQHVSILGAIIAGLALIFLAASGASELKQSLDDIWEAPKKKETFRRKSIRFLLSLLCVVLFGVTFVVFIVFANFLGQGAFRGTDIGILRPFEPLVTPAILFLLTYIGTLVVWIVLPDRKPANKSLLYGALVTAFLLTIGNLAVTWYLSHLASISTYGVAGSIVALLLWMYYSSLIFLFGSSFTWTYMRHL